jgi:sugar lactone lactonase YvrE
MCPEIRARRFSKRFAEFVTRNAQRDGDHGYWICFCDSTRNVDRFAPIHAALRKFPLKASHSR